MEQPMVPEKPDWSACRTIARQHGRTFFFASHFLPPKQRRAILAAYAYCRIADDIVDRAVESGSESAQRELDAWERELEHPIHPVAVAFAAARDEYRIPEQPVRDLLAGVRMDFAPARYGTWDELRSYCYHVAGTIGLIAAPILGCTREEALPQAVNLGIAMQLTNILRDVAEDAAIGRLYLPGEDLDAFGVCAESLLRGRPNGRFSDLMKFEIARARTLYQDGHKGVSALSPAGQITTIASSHLYAKILTRIEEQGYDVFRGRAYVPTHRKVQAVPTIAASFLRMQLDAIR